MEADKQAELAYHQRTYRAFVRGVVLVTAHAAVILLVLAYCSPTEWAEPLPVGAGAGGTTVIPIRSPQASIN